MNSEIAKSVKVMRVINEHLQEIDCHHNIKAIMKEALEESKMVSGNQPPTQNLIPIPEVVTKESNPNDYADT